MRSPHNLHRSMEHLKNPMPFSHRHIFRGTIGRKGRTQSSLGPCFGDQWDSSAVRIWRKSCQTHLSCQALSMLWVWGAVRHQTCRYCTRRPTSPSSDGTFGFLGSDFQLASPSSLSLKNGSVPVLVSRFVPTSKVVQGAS